MPVAPSFESYKRISAEPFCKNGKMYVTVEHPNTKNKRDVRWYSDAEFAKAYGKKVGDDPDKGFDGLKHARGFDLGPILVIRRNRPEDEDWLRASKARYAVGIGWHFVSEDIFGKGAVFPEDAPKNFKYVLLSWDEFRDGDDRHMKKPAQLAEIITKKMSNKEWVPING